MSEKNQQAIGDMFDRIASTYDRVNRILSFGQDIRWRKIVTKQLPSTPQIAVLDVATGTADLIIAMCKAKPNIAIAHGVDLSTQMLAFAQQKIVDHNLDKRIKLSHESACSMSFADSSFDVVSIAFGIRNVVEAKRALREMLRVLKPKGTLFVLEFSLPQNKLVRFFYLFYFRHILPRVGGFLSKDRAAYEYLNSSVESFPDSLAFREILLDVGFQKVEPLPLSCGIATLYCARKA